MGPSTNNTTRTSCPYSDPQVRSLHQGYASSVSGAYENNSGSTTNLKKIFSSFQTQTFSAKPSSKKRQPKIAEGSTSGPGMLRTNSKRDFKVKCMKIDLSKQLEYCNTETS